MSVKYRLEKLEQQHLTEAPYSAYIERLKESLKNEPPLPSFNGTYIELLQHALAGKRHQDDD